MSEEAFIQGEHEWIRHKLCVRMFKYEVPRAHTTHNVSIPFWLLQELKVSQCLSVSLAQSCQASSFWSILQAVFFRRLQVVFQQSSCSPLSKLRQSSRALIIIGPLTASESDIRSLKYFVLFVDTWPPPCVIIIMLRVPRISVFRFSFPAVGHNLWLIPVLSHRLGVTRQNTAD